MHIEIPVQRGFDGVCHGRHGVACDAVGDTASRATRTTMGGNGLRRRQTAGAPLASYGRNSYAISVPTLDF
eukprot:591832-Pleurochrysis_carterae.AAC.3